MLPRPADLMLHASAAARKSSSLRNEAVPCKALDAADTKKECGQHAAKGCKLQRNAKGIETYWAHNLASLEAKLPIGPYILPQFLQTL